MDHRAYAVVAAVGADRPGLVAALTELVRTVGGNVEDSRMAVLGGSFGIMMLISMPPERADDLTRALTNAEPSVGLRITVEPTSAPALSTAQRLSVDVEAVDREGIVHAVAAALHDLQANIVSLQTTRYPAPVSGAPLFKLAILADLPAGRALSELETSLDALAEAENLTCAVRRLGPG